ncbi:MAG: haloacid dehalogenase type II [Betaproteobacteria bacterium]
MPTTLGFDVYGTLIDTSGIAQALRDHAGEQAAAFAALWRSKQLEYAFRRGLMDRYRDFGVCTRHALDYCCLHFRVPIPDVEKATLMERYRFLPAFADAQPGLASLRQAGFRLFAFSMGRLDDVTALLSHAQLHDYFAGVISLEEMKCYKPSPAAYRHFVDTTGAAPADAWLVSGNPFDVLGAVSAGICGAWVKRSPEAISDPWEIAPTVVADDLPDLCEILVARARGTELR